jgi:VanZ family protein
VPKTHPLLSNSRLVSIALTLAIAYGSLYPFQFVYGNPYAKHPLAALIASWRTPIERSDFIANVVFYIPLGFFFARSISSRRRTIRITVAAVLAAMLSLTMELAQFYTIDRFTSLSDFCANTIGAILGAIVGALFLRSAPNLLRPLARRPFIFLLLISWLGWRLFPFVPTTDLHKYWDALKPIVYTPTLPFGELFRDVMVWLALGLLFEQLVGNAKSRFLLMLLGPAALAARIMTVDKLLSVSELVGAAAGCLLWFFVFSRLRRRLAVVAFLFAAAATVHDLQPFHFNAARHPLNWMPFLAILDASPEDSVVSFCGNIFIYGTLLWLANRAGLRLYAAAFVCTALVYAITIAQLFQPRRAPEITDVVVTLALAAILRALNEDSATGTAHAARTQATLCDPPALTVSEQRY